MGTTAEKLSYLEATKTAIRSAIAAKGVDVPESTPFRQYAEKVGEISGTISGVVVAQSDTTIEFEGYSSGGSLNITADQIETAVLQDGSIRLAFQDSRSFMDYSTGKLTDLTCDCVIVLKPTP